MKPYMMNLTVNLCYYYSLVLNGVLKFVPPGSQKLLRGMRRRLRQRRSTHLEV